MNTGNLYEFGHAWWAEARKKVKNAVVFLDAVSCECLHWNGGAASVFDAGATSIKEFSMFESVPHGSKKAVFITSSPLHGTVYKVLENLIRSSGLEYCVIITTAHVSVHHLLHWGLAKEAQHEMNAFHKVEQDVLSWMGNMNYTVEVFNYPLITTHPTKDVFLIPSARPVVPLLPSDLGYVNEQLMLFSKPKQKHSAISMALSAVLRIWSEKSEFSEHIFPQPELLAVRSTNDLTYSNLPLASQAQIRQLVNNLNQLLQHINARDEIFTVGSFSRIVGTELEALASARNRRKTASNKVSIIFVDRILDLASATECSSSNLFDRLFLTLNRLHEHSSDVAVKMTDKPEADLTVASGCLAPQSDWGSGWKTMQQLFHQNPQKGLERVTEDILQAGDSHQPLEDFLDKHSNDWDFIEQFTHLFQVSRAALQSRKSPNARKMDHLVSLQKSLVESLDDPDAPSPLIQVLQLIKNRAESELTLDDILVVLVYLYALTGDDWENVFPVELEDKLKSLLTECIVVDFDQLSEAFQDFVGIPVDEIRAHRAGQKIIEQLHHISGARSSLKRYLSLYQRLNPALPLECISLFQQLVEDIFDTAVSDNPDLEHRSGGLKDLLKTGFSLFVNVRKPKPTDPLVIVYVCGGIRPEEVKLLRDLFREKSPSHSVVIGSSHFVSVYDALDYIFKRNPHL